ncbi:putative lipoprotein [Leptospira weilii serovar Ranarum str. ICFT]|uniref:Lipoprotein n=1 Tax=Leptospira weilii serovar Ranarum str. ICFT TaxID=1218598 RepID=N1WV71_9LEPT|nr:hypothetical protein [Leptospira weilii]EMY79768.1 putative lipoprotein [Leptospira weilii serovar Ranarum str. ICFT]
MRTSKTNRFRLKAKLFRLFMIAFSTIALAYGCNSENQDIQLLISGESLSAKLNSAKSSQEYIKLHLWNTASIDDIKFNYIPFSWDPRVFSAQMDTVWQAFGLNINGVPITGKNYFLFAKKIADGTTSQRFDPRSDYFQAWFGIYIVNDEGGMVYSFPNNNFDPTGVVALAAADQIAWLANFANTPTNLLNVTLKEQPTVSSTQIDGHPGYLVRFRLDSNIDVGYQNNPNPPVYPYTSDPAFFNIPQSLWLNKLPFLYQSNTGYNKVTLECVGYVWHDKNRLNVVYYNGIVYKKSYGGGSFFADYRTLLDIGSELETMAKNVGLQ